ncbi:MAG: hypothetical protein A3J51_06585 [Omnitrophica WOR_2 bacterium RIFCSPHIGHO2_02_FULL_45_21]|nr:MAG: hypothetical protein A3J51_06585 [Omnitrophica WOR_2 bacterium RIFCSPHIGHO2_02_FULL_45_21]
MVRLSAGLFFIIVLLFAANNFSWPQEMPRQSQEAPGEQRRREQQPSGKSGDNIPQEQAAEDKIPEGESPAAAPLMEIKRLETKEPLYSFELRDADIADLFRVLAQDYKLNLLIDRDVQGKITASLSSVSLEEALGSIADSQNLILEKKGNITRVSPNLITKVFVLNSIEAKQLLEPSASAGEAQGEGASESGAGAGAKKETSTIYELISEKGIVLLGKQPNSIVVIDYPPNVLKIEGYLKAIDQKMGSRVFKLKYLKAADISGKAATTPVSVSGGGSAEEEGAAVASGGSAAAGE